MKLNDAEYYHRRAVEEELAARKAANSVARDRHDELAAMYRLRTAMLTTSPELWLEETPVIRTVEPAST